MLRIDGRVLAASVVGLFVVGAVLGFVAAGTGLAVPVSLGDDGTPTPAPTDAPTAAPTPTVVDTAAPAPTPTPTAVDTVIPTPTPTATPTVTPPPPTATPTRTPMLVRRFDEAEIESELRRMLNDWREKEGLQEFKTDGALVADLNAMARNHSVAMADAGLTLHEVDNRSSADRYHEYNVYWNCWFKADDGNYFVTPDDNSLEVLGRTYAGRTYETPNGTDYNANETAVAEDIFEQWTNNAVYTPRLSYSNATRIGVGIETTRNNEVYATANVCGPPNPNQ
ncbi:hypothetical protein BRC64_01280 [Halobacteriales archaeon QH_10_67_22]|nr:MAG: hypothetical protein BRC64_01280 [Halobacteriales archaeon QH_10_67_22]